MHIGFSLKDKRTQYWILAILWAFLSVSIGYKYVSSLNSPTAWKGWTFVEATLQKPNFLPYITPTDADKLYQSLLFQWCVHPVFSGVNVQFVDELCSVTTNDWQSFTVTLNKEKENTRSDGTPITLNDIYFTYRSVLKNNYRNIPHLDGLNTIQVNEDTDGLKIVFPKASKDNMIFFTNFILPAHILANISLEEYVVRFLQSPVVSTCVRLETAWNQWDNYVFNLSECENFSLKNYQIKWFKDKESMHAYINANTQIIDLSFDPLPESIYKKVPVLLNNYMSVFFNTTRPDRTARQRQWLSVLFNTLITWSGASTILTPDPYLFTVPSRSDEEIKQLLLPVPKPRINSWDTIPLEENVITFILDDTNKHVYSIQQPIEDKRAVTLRFPESYARVWITQEWWIEYFPQSRDGTTKSLQYNLSESVSTIKTWKNTYTVIGYPEQWDPVSRKMTIWYRDNPPAPVEIPQEPASLKEPFVVLYFEDETTTPLIEQFKIILEQKWWSSWFEFQPFTDTNSLEGKLTSKEYDVVFRTISFWLRKDLSTLFSTDNPVINPSAKKNETLSSLTTTFFLSDNQKQKDTILAQISENYWSDPQLVILGKLNGGVRVKKHNGITYPSKLYVLWRRKNVLQKIQLFQHIAIDRNYASQRSTIRTFLKKNLFWR